MLFWLARRLTGPDDGSRTDDAIIEEAWRDDAECCRHTEHNDRQGENE